MIRFPSRVHSDLKVIRVQASLLCLLQYLESYENVLITPMRKSILPMRKNTLSTKTQAGECQPRAHPDRRRNCLLKERKGLVVGY